MRSVTLRLDDLRTTILNLGYVGENEHTRFIFDCKRMFDQYPSASASLTVAPPAGESYPAVIERDGDLVTWVITDSDLIHDGCGEIQLSFTESETVAKTFIARTKVSRSLVPAGEIPEGIDDFLTRAGAVLTAIPETIEEALADAKASGEFDGPPGEPGQDGYSPTATVSKSGKTATITITDKNGTTTAQISDGEGGGTSDYSALDNKPQIAGVTLSGNVSLHDIGAAAESAIPDPTSIIDDTAGDGDTNKTWSADKLNDVKSAINSKMDEPETEGTDGQVLTTDGNGGRSWTDKPTVPAIATSAQIKAGTDSTHPIAPNRQNESVFYALAKLAGADMASLSGETVGVYPDAQKVAIQKMLGIYEPPFELIKEITLSEIDGIDVSTDENGNPFSLREVFIQILYPENAESISSGYSRFCVYDGALNSSYVTFETGKYTTSSSKKYKLLYLERHGNLTLGRHTGQQTIGSQGQWVSKSASTNGLSEVNGYGSTLNLGNVTRIASYSGDKEPAGTIIRIYGQKAY